MSSLLWLLWVLCRSSLYLSTCCCSRQSSRSGARPNTAATIKRVGLLSKMEMSSVPSPAPGKVPSETNPITDVINTPPTAANPESHGT